MPFPDAARALAADLVTALAERGWTATTAESCTGGLIAGLVTEIPGSSVVFRRGVITYADEEKTALLGVEAPLLEEHGAVSEATARAMAAGALARAGADLALAVTGIAGPGGATAGKPVGLVHLATLTRNGGAAHQGPVFEGDRSAIRLAAAQTALEMGLALVRA